MISPPDLPGSTSLVVCSPDQRSIVETRPLPTPTSREILLRLHFCGLCGTDLFKLQHPSSPAPQVLGHEVVGTVVWTGGDVRGISDGDRVVVPHHVACGECELCRKGSETLCREFRVNLLSPGGFSEFVLIRERGVASALKKIPADVPDEAAIFVEPGACVVRGIRRAGHTLSESQPANLTCLILGAGSMGLLHLLILKALSPLTRVLLSDPISERREFASSLGADVLLDPGSPTWLESVRKMSSGDGVDTVFDTVGGAATLSQGLSATREGGTVILFAHSRPGEIASFDINSVFKYERRIIATYSGSLKEQDEVFNLLQSRTLDPSPLVSHRLPFSEFDKAIELSSRHLAHKILLYPDHFDQIHHSNA